MTRKPNNSALKTSSRQRRRIDLDQHVPAAAGGCLRPHEGASQMSITAADILTSPVISVAPEASLAEIAALLADKHISAVPVCRADGTLAGLVSEADVVRPFRESARVQRDWVAWRAGRWRKAVGGIPRLYPARYPHCGAGNGAARDHRDRTGDAAAARRADDRPRRQAHPDPARRARHRHRQPAAIWWRRWPGRRECWSSATQPRPGGLGSNRRRAS